MKNIILKVCIIPLVIFASSCSDWLDVKPKAEIKMDVMFETEQGVKDALVGCYIKMSESSLYGAELTCTFLDVLAQQYQITGSKSGSYYNASRYTYTASNCESTIERIWSKMYNVIANVNALIEGLETSRKNIHPSIYSMCKAEAYGLRAYLYFDLVRLFTWGNLTSRPEKLDELSIPYGKEYNKNIVPQSKLKDVLQYIHEDLDIALELFDLYDPSSRSGNRPENYELPNEDKFYEPEVQRYRMNLKAAMALNMRINMWEGNYVKAYEIAKELEDFDLPFVYNMDVDENNRDLTFSEEMLFGLETHERYEKITKTYFKLTSNDDVNKNYNALALSKNRVNELFEVDKGVGASDWRYTRWWDKSGYNYCFLKFWEYEDMKFKNNQPLIRTSEVYYTLTECILRLGKNRTEAIQYLNKVRINRNIPTSVNLSYDLSEDEVWDELKKEWKKDFIGDGQMFYFYKRLGYTSIPYGPALDYDDKVYVLPLPQLEVDFGGRVELVKKEDK